MGHTNSTANLSLPQFIGTDKPTWLGDVNGAFSAIDGYVGTNDAAVAAAASDASSAISQAAAAVNTANTANTTAGNASTAATAAVTAANQANALSNQVALRTGVLSDLTTTDKTSIVNAINEVNGKDAGDIAYDNTGSGLTATNVQDAIDEVAQGGGGSVPHELGTAVDITSYAAQNNCYTCPSDGYVKLYCNDTTNVIGVAYKDGNTLASLHSVKYNATSFYVRAGMEVYVITNTGTGNTVTFVPFV